MERKAVEIFAGQMLDATVDWIAITFAITLTACPVLAVPCSFTKAGRPVGIQLFGRPHGEANLLAAGWLLEQTAGVAEMLPIEPRVGV